MAKQLTLPYHTLLHFKFNILSRPSMVTIRVSFFLPRPEMARDIAPFYISTFPFPWSTEYSVRSYKIYMTIDENTR